MEKMEDEACTMQFEEVYNLNKSTDDWLFDQIVAQLQEILISDHFETSLTHFMNTHWAALTSNSQKTLTPVFQQYQTQIRSYLHENIRRKVPQFEWPRFLSLLSTRKQLIDQQIADTLHSLDSFEGFKLFVQDYRTAHEEEERLKVLTIKSNKISEHKTVKGKDNIFSQGQNKNNLFGRPLKAPNSKKRASHEKNEDQLLVPQLILTVKSMRKV